LLNKFLIKGRTITQEYYVKLLEKLIRRIRRKRPNLEEEGIFFFSDNAHQIFQSTEGMELDRILPTLPPDV
jgi:hypothetical protein